MAKVKPGVVSKLSGKVAGSKFYNTKLGTIMGTNTDPIYVITPAKEKSWLDFKKSQSPWALLNMEQVKGWNALGKSLLHRDRVGNIIPYRGRDIFNKVNRNLLEIGEPFLLNPPRKIYPEPLSNPDAELFANDKEPITINDIKVYFDKPISKNTKYIIYATAHLRPGINVPKPGWYRKIKVIDSGFKSGSSIFYDYLSVFKKSIDGTFRIALLFKPVSRISGFDIEPDDMIVSIK
jgi:hypothetical protein